MTRATVYCLHGFLGRPADWDFLDGATPHALKKVDVFSGWSHGSMADWARDFNLRVSAGRETPRLILGYSMGGRLALHSLVENPTLWDAAVIVSANPGLVTTEAERSARLAQDEAWARRFESEAWEKVVSDWNQLPVFAGSAPIEARCEAEFDRQRLAHALRDGSPAVTPNLSDKITQLKIPMAWVAGALDPRYAAIATQMGAGFEVKVIAGAGHRVPWDQPAAFMEYFCGFLERFLLNRS